MKRFFALLLAMVALLPISSAFAIEFHSIPWGISINELINELNSRGIPASIGDIKSDCDLPKWTYEFYDITDDVDNTGFSVEVDYYYSDDKTKVAGHPVYRFNFYAHYDISEGILKKDADDSQFYLAKIMFDYNDKIAAVVYDDLATKLNGLYGDGTEGVTSLSGINYYYTVWEDEDNSAVCLYHMAYTDDHFHSVDLIYGNTVINDTLENVRKLVIENDIKEVANDTTGL